MLVSHIIRIENDDIAELMETFSVVLSSNDNRIIVPMETSTAEITIMDTDSKSFVGYSVKLSLLYVNLSEQL